MREDAVRWTYNGTAFVRCKKRFYPRCAYRGKSVWQNSFFLRQKMKLHLNTTAGQNAITGHGAGYVQVNQQRIETALIVMPNEVIQPWHVTSMETLTLDAFAEVIALKPELVVFGSGAKFRFPHARVMAAFSQARIGFEAMDTGAACRTYNVLMSEGRNVAAALLVE
jgi:uncharacterized protein